MLSPHSETQSSVETGCIYYTLRVRAYGTCGVRKYHDENSKSDNRVVYFIRVSVFSAQRSCAPLRTMAGGEGRVSWPGVSFIVAGGIFGWTSHVFKQCVIFRRAEHLPRAPSAPPTLGSRHPRRGQARAFPR